MARPTSDAPNPSNSMAVRSYFIALFRTKHMNANAGIAAAGTESLKILSLTTAGATPVDYTIIKKLTGGTGPLLLTRLDGRQFVLKAELNASGHTLVNRNAHEANEYLAFQLYKAAGCRIPEGVDFVKVLIEGKDVVGVLEDFIDGETLYNLMAVRDPQLSKLTFPAIQRDLVIHALLANWDINMMGNIMIARITDTEGKVTYDYSNPITIDCGGTLLFRAMGQLKDKDAHAGGSGSGYLAEVTNVESIVGYAANYKPFGPLKYVPKDALHAKICERWVGVNKDAIMAAFGSAAVIVAPYFAARGLNVDDQIGEILTRRMAHFDRLCGAAAAPPVAGAATSLLARTAGAVSPLGVGAGAVGGAGAVAANKGGSRRSRRRSVRRFKTRGRRR
jgi:hypothetical protein